MSGEIPMSQEGNREFKLEDKTKDILVGLGYSENINYSFISEKLIKNSSLDIDDHIKISNPLSGDFEYMRTTLVPGLLQSIKENEKAVKILNIFELSKIYINKKDDLPDEKTNLCIAVAGDDTEKSFFDAKGSLSVLLQRLNIGDYELKPLKKEELYWNGEESAKIIIGDEEIGTIGAINKEILLLFGIKKAVAIAEIDFVKVMELAKDGPAYKPIAKFPGSDLDISMEIDEKVLYKDVVDSIKDIDKLIKQVLFLSVYQGENIPKGKKALAIRVHYRNDEKTLELADAQSAHDKVVEKLKKEYNITIR
jgi:phenylalanyl-tRNA synthetase beta chain